jgi:uracil phosphoribosyltransferase
LSANLARKTVRARTHETKVSVVEHPLVAAKLGILRDASTGTAQFRRNLQEISMLLLMEAARSWETEPRFVQTPLAKHEAQGLRRPVVFVPILRAGLAMADGMTRLLPEASLGHIGVYRDEKTLQPTTYFCRLPALSAEAQVLLLDPMLATGNSACEAMRRLKEGGASRIQFVCLLACPPGLERLRTAHPDVDVITAAIDPTLSELGYIVPGLGDAGDRYFGTE